LERKLEGSHSLNRRSGREMSLKFDIKYSLEPFYVGKKIVKSFTVEINLYYIKEFSSYTQREWAG
jgi:hypothetical protein